ncbi:uncharacterized protein A4U43_C06F6770 [Asparagus officinalis]|uniref:Uncharacterized protein n=1 Tax=Asparagus officinalis TaxID=4686 RepID=A0A5P1EK32_ASPOF|nr:uncharacterized protein A4U43_C06F6770 [Asparagus officinalis]
MASTLSPLSRPALLKSKTLNSRHRRLILTASASDLGAPPKESLVGVIEDSVRVAQRTPAKSAGAVHRLTCSRHDQDGEGGSFRVSRNPRRHEVTGEDLDAYIHRSG